MGNLPPNEAEAGFAHLSQANRLDRICDLYERECTAEKRSQPRMEDFLAMAPAADRHLLRRELEAVRSEYEIRRRETGDTSNVRDTVWPTRHIATCGKDPAHIGRYRIKNLLGEGGFGRVYLAHDEQLDRLVAVKVPHARMLSQSEHVAAYLAEARTVANLDHAGIVPVYDVGSTGEHPCYVVSKYIEGTDLSARLKEGRPPYRESAELVATVAEALHYAHQRGTVHRDVKPGNILIGSGGRTYIVDFGLALREEDIGKGPKYLGTPAYMSPEQASGEGHRLDGRSDVFSLGVVLYELLAGDRPFPGKTQADLLEQLTVCTPLPLREHDHRLPPELERICQKALAKRASERYASAQNLADDLRHFLARQTVIPGSAAPEGCGTGTAEGVDSAATRSGSAAGPPTNIVPKGLRSFDGHDADFFLELLPGPRDRDGLPDSLRFWKTRIEETDPDNTFSVGLIYGPSGCGKSSLLKAGLLPRLSENVIPIYIEATPEETETRLLHGIRKRCPTLDDGLVLKETLAALRQGRGVPVGKKVLIVLDQFEQWLHAKMKDDNTELVQALRQCDGGRVQCLVIVRDDFWLSVSRFLRELEVRLVEGENSALSDLFDPGHARKVLEAFGRAFGKLPESASETTQEQKAFLKQSVSGLVDEGKVICVRLALFAEMMKGKPWTPAMLKEVGGTRGVGMTFLEETFSASTAPPEHRYHQKAARAILKALLPESGTGIKGEMKSHGELLEACGYAGRPQDFDDLIRILDREIRLITPTDPEGRSADEDSLSHVAAGRKYFQLTHDYLVPSLRDWLTRKQKETWRGRAELRLAERSALWNAKPENRRLPSWWEYSANRLLTDKMCWTESQRKMMGKAGRVHGLRTAVVALLLVALVVGGVAIRNAIDRKQHDAEAARLVDGLLQADTSQVETVIENLADYQPWAKDDLNAAFAKSSDDSNAKLHAALAMLPEDKAVLPFLKERLLTVSPNQFAHVRNLLASHKGSLIGDYWKIAKDREEDAARRFQAACALASFDPHNEHWQDKEFGELVARHLVSVWPSELLPWRNALRPVREHLRAPLAAVYRDENRDLQVRGFATDTLADYLSDDADALFDLLADADKKQFVQLFDKLAAHRERAIQLGTVEVSRTFPEDAGEDEKEALAIRRANAAIMLLRMDAPGQTWPLLKHSPDPRVRSYLIHWLSSRGGNPKTVIARYEQETDVTIKRALLLCLGGFDESQLPDRERTPLVDMLLTVYRTDPDAGLHAAAEWLLRKWDQGEKITAIDKELQQNEQRLIAERDKQRQWYINRQGQTFVILDASRFQMGSPESEAGRNPSERLHQRKIGRRIAISTKEVTKAQWQVFAESVKIWTVDEEQLKPYIRTDDSPMLWMTWYEAAWYCNWLSEVEGIPEDQWCYETNGMQEYGPGMRAKQNFLELTGYRLPTEAEWEFACRAGAKTSHYYGAAETLLAQYAWYQENGDDHAWPVASLKPNDFGLFDMHGNAFERCHDVFGSYPSACKEAVADAPKADVVSETVSRVVRGGSFNYHAFSAPSARRDFDRPGDRYFNDGFRLTRTFHESG